MKKSKSTSRRTKQPPRKLRIDQIKIGERHRKDLGDIDSFAENIKEIGLLHPIVIKPDRTLAVGERRLAACKKLKWKSIPVTIDRKKIDIVRSEYSENIYRKDFLPTEIESIRRELEPLERATATSRKLSGRSTKNGGETRDKVGRVAGASGRTVEKIRKVMEAAEAEPEKFGDLPGEMDRTGKVDAAYAKVRRHERHKAIAKKTNRIGSANRGPFLLFYIDAPWEVKTYSEEGQYRTGGQHYETLTDEQIINFRVVECGGQTIPELAHTDAALFLWATSSNLERALEVMRAWNFTYKTHAIWDKEIIGTGVVFRNQHELLLYGTRGNMPAPQHVPASVFRYKRTEHSAKPAKIRAELEKMYPDFDERTRIELFARGQFPGWTCVGFESSEDKSLND